MTTANDGAWLLLATTGLFLPTDRYIVSAPRQPKIVLHRPSGDLVIEAEPAPAPGLVPTRVTLDEKELEQPYLTHAELVGPHRLRFSMGPE
jgi:putative alpha-1,2-mannosidase